MNRYLNLIAATAFVLALLPTTASATSITTGTRIVVSPTTIAVPIEIVDAHSVVGWQFDLTYDATDLQVNTGCDSFAGDIYCSLLTGPVTEGDFFAAGSPFNLLIPGFVDLDSITLDQTGLLFGAAGAFGGSTPPFPSGDGTLAFVEFTVLGTGTSPIGVVNSSTDAVAAPEPATVFLLLGGLPFVRLRRSSRSRFLVVCLIVAGLLMSPRFARAQTTAVGPYYATPSWDQSILCATTSNCARFVVLSNMRGEAVLDRETGLVWERTPDTVRVSWEQSRFACANKAVGGVRGFRLPSIHEATTLLTETSGLPPGHPFNVDFGDPSTGLPEFWTATVANTAPGITSRVDGIWAFNADGIRRGGGGLPSLLVRPRRRPTFIVLSRFAKESCLCSRSVFVSSDY
jgi:hypothetical protein